MSAHSGTKSQYAAQLVVEFPVGDARNLIGNSIREIVDRVKERDRIDTVFVTLTDPPDQTDVATAAQFFSKYKTQLVRVYLIGHGDFRAGQIGGFSGDQVAKALALCGFSGFGTISVIGCQLGMLENTGYDALVDASEVNFVAVLHRTLKTEHKIETVVHARVGFVGFYTLTHLSSGKIKDMDLVGRKFTRMEEIPAANADYSKMHKVKNSKLIFYWDGNEQKRGWAY